jgi:CMP-N-acetylneuraminic acid synthetase
LIKQCVEVLKNDAKKKTDSVITCQKIVDTSHPDYVLDLDTKGFVKFGSYALDEFARQKLHPMYSCKGIVLLSRILSYKQYKSFFSGNCKPVFINDPIRGLDINNSLDLDIARAVARLYPEKMY